MVETSPLISVVIPALNEERSLSACLDSVLVQDFPNMEILVVDGGSTDRTRAIVEDYCSFEPRVRLVHNPRRTQPAALNVALTEVRSPFLVRVDAHSTISPGYVRRVYDHISSGTWGGVGGRKDGVAYSNQGQAIATALGSKFGVGNSTYHHGTEPSTVDHIPFGAYPVALATTLGGWDENIVANEDYEFDYRVRQAGNELLFDPKLRIQWETRQSIGAFFQQYRRYGRGKALVLKKHPESASPRHLLPAAVVAGLAGSLVVALKRPRLGLSGVGAYALGVGVAGALTAPQTPNPAARRWIPAAFAAMHLGYGIGFWESLVARRRPQN